MPSTSSVSTTANTSKIGKKRKNFAISARISKKLRTFASDFSKSGCSAVGSALRSGRRGRAFESPHPDQKKARWSSHRPPFLFNLSAGLGRQRPGSAFVGAIIDALTSMPPKVTACLSPREPYPIVIPMIPVIPQTSGDGSSCLTRCAVSGICQTEKNRPRVFD